MRWLAAITLVAVVLVGCKTETLVYERALDDGPSFSAYLVSYRSDGLKIHAMVAVPKMDMPDGGFPVIVANHGYVPDPTRHGITADGRDSRPGDYYRSVPELYASRGFLVVLPDYRGHNSSEGLEFTGTSQSVDYYADDVVALLALLGQVETADLNRVFMWSHSMGGGVSMRALLASDLVKAASFWATMSVEDLTPLPGELGAAVIIHHSVDDQSTDSTNGRALAVALAAAGLPHSLYEYEGSDHYFEAEIRELAADRDVALFNSIAE
jgi:dienelactone hydrolase